MTLAVRIVKRVERERPTSADAPDNAGSNELNLPDVAKAVQGWITASRERRQAEVINYRQVFK